MTDPPKPRGMSPGMSEQSVICRSPDVLGGTPVFRGTRVPVGTLLDYLEAADSLDDFLREFPSVSRAQAIAAMEMANAGGRR